MSAIHEILKKRKEERKKYKLNQLLRIKRRFRQQKEQLLEQINSKIDDTDGSARKQRFYETLFKREAATPSEPTAPVQQDRPPRKSKQQLNEQRRLEREQQQQRKRQEREHSRHLIKKMHTQRTKKGQPLMRNYIEYALHKLQSERNDKQK